MNTLTQEKAELQYKVRLADALSRLKTNTDFVTVFEMAYFKDHVLGLVRLLGKSDVTDPQIIQALKEVGGVQRYFEKINNDGAMAKESLKELEAIPLSE